MKPKYSNKKKINGNKNNVLMYIITAEICLNF